MHLGLILGGRFLDLHDSSAAASYLQRPQVASVDSRGQITFVLVHSRLQQKMQSLCFCFFFQYQNSALFSQHP